MALRLTNGFPVLYDFGTRRVEVASQVLVLESTVSVALPRLGELLHESTAFHRAIVDATKLL
jgi:hypothetical protein